MKKLIYSCFLVLFVTSFLSAQVPQAKVFTEPVTPHSLTTLGLTTNSVSPGLPVFANGTYLYVSAKEVLNGQPVLTSVFNLIQRPAGSVAVLEDLGIAHWKGLKADVKGTYKVEVTLTTAGGTDQDTGTFYAGDYMGVGTFSGVTGTFPSCKSCHDNAGWPVFQDIFTRWEASGHANIFNYEIDNGAAYYSTSCMKCHTTGYDHNITAANNGFDDVAASLGWVWAGPPAPGKWAALKSTYPGLVKFATIGCENCHGAGSLHPSAGLAGSQFKTMATYEAGSCAQCHDEPWRHNKYAQYENSTHAEALWTNSFAQSSASQNNSLNNCIRCHDAKGYINFTKGLITNTTGMTRASHLAVTCQTCHDPHGNSNFASLRNSPSSSDTLGNGYAYTTGGNGKICMDCHKARRDNVSYQNTNISSTWGPHHSVQTDNFFGKNAYQFGATPYLTNSHQFAVTDACATCHMVATTDTGTVNRDKVGGHTFKMHNEDTGYDHTTSCTSCHGPKTSFSDFLALTDYDGDGTIEPIQGEVDGLLQNIRLFLPPIGQDTIIWTQIRSSSDSVLYKRAYWNYQLMAYDGSRGMHNSKFTFDVLMKTYAALGGIVPVELVSFKAEVGSNGVTLNWETATETNNKGFDIERSINGNWSKIGFVEGKGTTTELNSYSYSDKPSTSGKVSYRLKQIDLDGSFTYSKVVDVDFGTMPKEFSLSQNYPNPFNPSTMIKFALPFDSKVKVTIYNINGEVVKVLVDGEYAAGEHQAQFSINSASGIASGVYLYSISAVSNDGHSNFVQTKKMVLIK